MAEFGLEKKEIEAINFALAFAIDKTNKDIGEVTQKGQKSLKKEDIYHIYKDYKDSKDPKDSKGRENVDKKECKNCQTLISTLKLIQENDSNAFQKQPYANNPIQQSKPHHQYKQNSNEIKKRVGVEIT